MDGDLLKERIYPDGLYQKDGNIIYFNILEFDNKKDKEFMITALGKDKFEYLEMNYSKMIYIGKVAIKSYAVSNIKKMKALMTTVVKTFTGGYENEETVVVWDIAAHGYQLERDTIRKIEDTNEIIVEGVERDSEFRDDIDRNTKHAFFY